MDKHLLYSGSGTQYSSYACGIMYSDEGPLIGFKRQEKHDPLTLKRTGLLRGAGHGSIAEGPDNTYWIFYTYFFGHNYKFERRVGMDPLGIDENGELFCPQLTETPQFAPGVKKNPEKGNDAGLLPLTFFQPVKATSHMPGREPIYATDDSAITWWQPTCEDGEKMLTIDLCVDYRTFPTVTARKVRLTVLGAPKGIEPGVISFTVFGKCAH